MKTKCLTCVLLALVAIATELPAQQSDLDRKTFEDTKSMAENGNADAQLLLGCAYFSGEGMATNEIEAVKWWRKAADQNHAIAQRALGSCYQEGKGIKKDIALALKWFRRAAENNDAKSQVNLGDTTLLPLLHLSPHPRH